MKKTFLSNLLKCTFFLVILMNAGQLLGQNVAVSGGTTAAGSYLTLGDAFNAINLATVTGNILVEIQANTTESTNIGLGVNTNGFTVTLRPDEDADRTITFTKTSDNTSPTGHLVVGYLGTGLTSAWSDANTIATSNVTIDGFAAGKTTRRLTFTNTSASHTNARVIMVVGACSNTVIKNCIINNLTTSTGSPFCVGAVIRQSTTIDVAPSGLTIDNNILTSTSNNVSMGARITNSGSPTTKLTGFVFKNNKVTAKRRLLEINYTSGGEIFNNEFTTLATGAAGSVSYGLWTSAGVDGTFNIYNNKFLKSLTEETGAYGHRVISLASNATSNIYNNTFAGMDKTKVSTAAINLSYLFYSGLATGKIYNNTFYMPSLTNASTDASKVGYYRAIVLSGNTAEIKNNIFISDEANHTNTGFISAIPSNASDNNVFYQRVANANATIIPTYATLAAYQAAYPTKDINSKSVNVNFTNTATGDLTITGASIGDGNLGMPRLATVLTDILGTPRATKTYAGAHEASNLSVSTWNGTVWLPSAPDAFQEAIIAGAYSTATNNTFTAKNLTVNSGGSLTINSGTNLTLHDELINNAGAAAVVIENNANLIQVNDANNIGAITVHRNSSLLKLNDYTLWSSPVVGQQLKAFSPDTVDSRFYIYNTTGVSPFANVYATQGNTVNFQIGKGYLIRMPNNASSTIPTAYAGVFTGIPNNGDISFPLISGPATERFNLIGNPYPSPISISQFVTDNSADITGTLYFWRRTNNVSGIYPNSAYCTVVGGVFTSNGDDQAVDPAGIIQTGQGFFVETVSGTPAIVFNNAQRSTNTAGQFFKTKQAVESNVIWLNATSTDGAFSQMALGYHADGTVGVDQYDGKAFGDGTFAFNSTINNVAYSIQGRPAFDASDVVALNFKTATAGTYTIAKDHANGLFAAGQEVYLVDATNGTQTNLQTDAYTFEAAEGTDNSRFSLIYQKTLGVNAPAFNENSVKVYRSNGVLTVTSGADKISNIKVYDIQGRLLAEQKNINATTSTIKDLKASHQVLIVKVTSADTTVVTKKVVN